MRRHPERRPEARTPAAVFRPGQSPDAEDGGRLPLAGPPSSSAVSRSRTTFGALRSESIQQRECAMGVRRFRRQGRRRAGCATPGQKARSIRDSNRLNERELVLSGPKPSPVNPLSSGRGSTQRCESNGPGFGLDRRAVPTQRPMSKRTLAPASHTGPAFPRRNRRSTEHRMNGYLFSALRAAQKRLRASRRFYAETAMRIEVQRPQRRFRHKAHKGHEDTGRSTGADTRYESPSASVRLVGACPCHARPPEAARRTASVFVSFVFFVADTSPRALLPRWSRR